MDLDYAGAQIQEALDRKFQDTPVVTATVVLELLDVVGSLNARLNQLHQRVVHLEQHAALADPQAQGREND